jgi:hypothetical protein
MVKVSPLYLTDKTPFDSKCDKKIRISAGWKRLSSPLNIKTPPCHAFHAWVLHMLRDFGNPRLIFAVAAGSNLMVF